MTNNRTQGTQCGAVSGEDQVGVRERFITRGRWAWPQCQSSRSAWRMSSKGLDFGWCCVEPQVGFSDPCPFQIGIFCDANSLPLLLQRFLQEAGMVCYSSCLVLCHKSYMRPIMIYLKNFYSTFLHNNLVIPCVP